MHLFNFVNSCALSAVDNGTREGLDKFLKAASESPETVLHYEFMQDYKVFCIKVLSGLEQLWTNKRFGFEMENKLIIYDCKNHQLIYLEQCFIITSLCITIYFMFLSCFFKHSGRFT